MGEEVNRLFLNICLNIGLQFLVRHGGDELYKYSGTRRDGNGPLNQ